MEVGDVSEEPGQELESREGVGASGGPFAHLGSEPDYVLCRHVLQALEGRREGGYARSHVAGNAAKNSSSRSP